MISSTQSTPIGSQVLPSLGTLLDSTHMLEKVLNRGNQQEVHKALASLAGPDACLDLSEIRLDASGLKAVCAVLGNPLSTIRFDKVIWGRVPDHQPIIDCLPYTLARVFDISRLETVWDVPEHHIFRPRDFDDFGALLNVCRKTGTFKVQLVVDSRVNTKHQHQLEQLRAYGVVVTDVWRQTMLRRLNVHELSEGWRKNADIDLHFEADGDAQILSRTGMWMLVETLNAEIDGITFEPIKNCLILGRVAAMDGFFSIDARRMPKCLDLSHVRICDNESDAGTKLTDQEANRLVDLIQSELDLEQGSQLSLKVLRIDVSGMSQQAVLKLEDVCRRAHVSLEISVQPIAQAVQHPVVMASDGRSHAPTVEVDAELSAQFEKLCVEDSAWQIAEDLEKSPETVAKLSARVRQQLQSYAETLQATGGSLMRDYGDQISKRLKSDVSAGASESGAPAVAIDHSLSSQFETACKDGDASWIARQLMHEPEIVQKLAPDVVKQIRIYADSLVAGYGSLYQELGAIILRRLPPG